MADNIAEIRKLFSDNGVSLSSSDVWSVQGASVVKHKALERLASALKIRWQEPKILRAERDEAVILVTGAIGEHMEWSIGEALIVAPSGVGGNYKVSGKQASYVWAMAEKRGKDRVIIKLAGIDAYSEEESDDFTQRNQSREPSGPSSDELYLAQANNKIAEFTDRTALDAWYQAETENRQRMLDAEQIAALFKRMKARRQELNAEIPASDDRKVA